VDTIVRPPDAPTEAPIAPRPRRRSPAILLIPIIVAVVLFASTWISNYDPFIPGTRGYSPQDPRMRTSDVSVFGVNGRVFTVPTSDPTHFRYTFSIVNDGPIAVTITGVGSPVDEPPAALTTHPVRVIPDERSPGPDGDLVYEPWHPFVLRPGTGGRHRDAVGLPAV
jgi:hypothetical protein